MENEFYQDTSLSESDIPLSESNVSIKLAALQLRCAELLKHKETSIELTLEDAVTPSEPFNPYNRG